jgi:hypothetical protein
MARCLLSAERPTALRHCCTSVRPFRNAAVTCATNARECLCSYEISRKRCNQLKMRPEAPHASHGRMPPQQESRACFMDARRPAYLAHRGRMKEHLRSRIHTCSAAASTRASPPDGRCGAAAAERLRRCLGRFAPAPAVSAADAFLRLVPAFLSLGRDGACAIENMPSRAQSLPL